MGISHQRELAPAVGVRGQIKISVEYESGLRSPARRRYHGLETPVPQSFWIASQPESPISPNSAAVERIPASKSRMWKNSLGEWALQFGWQ